MTHLGHADRKLCHSRFKEIIVQRDLSSEVLLKLHFTVQNSNNEGFCFKKDRFLKTKHEMIEKLEPGPGGEVM